MLSRTTWRITALPLRRHLSRTSCVAQVDNEPSTSRAALAPAAPLTKQASPTAHMALRDRHCHMSATEAAFQTTRWNENDTPTELKATFDKAGLLRQELIDIPVELLKTPDELFNQVARILWSHPGRSRRRLSRLEKHVILHVLIRRGQTELAFHCLVDWMKQRRLPQFSEVSRHELSFNPTSLAQLFTKTTRRKYLQERQMVDVRSHKDFPKAPPLREPIRQPTIEEQRPPPLREDVAVLVTLLDEMRATLHRRRFDQYVFTMRVLISAGRPDEAAKVYATLVEDWVMEGRTALGARPEEFSTGGVPAPGKTTTASSERLFKSWFGNVRTWRWPGEAMSLHDRLDLWHPQQSAPDERLRGFPLPLPSPTAPPTQVPVPTNGSLEKIVVNLRLDPYTASPVEYATSMRALATLANTILSRSLPIAEIPRLLIAFSNSRTHPAVYPDTFSEPLPEDAWGYTAHTQVHVALVSLMFSPPNYALAARIYNSRNTLAILNPRRNRMKKHQGLYSLPPLTMSSCVILVSYACQKLRQPRLLKGLFDYMKSTFYKAWPTPIYNQLLRSSSLLKDFVMGREVEQVLFNDSHLSAAQVRQAAAVIGVQPLVTRAHQNYDRSSHTSQPNLPAPPEEPIFDLAPARADSGSVIALLFHLAMTNQRQRLIDTVFLLLPHLRTSRVVDEEERKRIQAVTGAPIDPDGRIRPTELSMHLYGAIMGALYYKGFYELVQRVGFIAQQMETRYTTRALAIAKREAAERGLDPSHASIDLSDLRAFRVPIHIETITINMWASQVQYHDQVLSGLRVPKQFEGLSRGDSARKMAMVNYERVFGKYRKLNPDERVALFNTIPDTRFFDAMIRALKPKWDLDSTTLTASTEAEIRRLVEDMTELDITPPSGLLAKLNPPHRIANPEDVHFRRAAMDDYLTKAAETVEGRFSESVHRLFQSGNYTDVELHQDNVPELNKLDWRHEPRDGDDPAEVDDLDQVPIHGLYSRLRNRQPLKRSRSRHELGRVSNGGKLAREGEWRDPRDERRSDRTK